MPRRTLNLKLLELKIRNVRGLPDLDLKLNGKSVVIWGPNGAGKSCLVDAIEFLFTGRISRLTGEGTQGITLTRHGPHIDHEPKSASVSAILQLDGCPGPVELSRRMDQPDTLICPDEAREALARIGDLMERGGVVLTRRDILRFVAAEAGKRADEIESLLNLKDVDDIRKGLVSARTVLQNKEKASIDAIGTAKSDVNVTLGLQQYSDEGLVERVNAARQELGGDQLDQVLSSSLKHGIAPPSNATGGQSSANPKLIQQAVQNLRNRYLLCNKSDLAREDESLRKNLDELAMKPELLDELERLELNERAASFVDDSTLNCPVCGASWSEGQLKGHLDEKIAAAHLAKALRQQIQKSTEALATPAGDLLANLSALIEGISSVDFTTEQESLVLLEGWKTNLTDLLAALNDPLGKYLDGQFSRESVSRLYAPASIDELLSGIEKTVVEVLPQPTEEQTAWDKLTQLEVSLRALENRISEKNSHSLNAERSRILLAEYERARDTVLEDLYGRIAARFAEFYCVLHSHEGDNFAASLNPAGARLSFEVDFMGRGSHPPQALHSEGHQDSMGVCLFLALNEELAESSLELIVLDDVMMSVDAGHRKEVCRLLSENFPECQFVITTHDRTWSKQLRQERVVEPSQVIEFTGWTVEGGPKTHQQMDLWAKIQEDLDREEVSEAAFKLRRGSEDFFEGVCDALGAQLVYNSAMQWQLDDWMKGATSRYKEIIGDGRKAAQSWGNKKGVEEFDALGSVRRQIYDRAGIEQWAINASIHYNSWADMSKEEFSDVVDAFRDLHGLFVCPACSGLLELIPRKGTSEIIKCRCGAVTWNLSRKSGKS